MARRDKHQLGRALAISVGLHLAVLSLQFGLSGKNWPALGWSWGEREASVPLPSRRVELRAGSVETAVTPSSPLPIQLPVARTTATPDMPRTLIVTLLPPPLPKPVPTPPVLPQPVQQRLTPPPVPVVHKKIRGKKGSPILSVAQASSDETWFVPPMATGDKTGKKDKKEEPSVTPPEVPESMHAQQDVTTPTPVHVVAEAETQPKLHEQEQQALRARERAEQEQRQLAERAEAERIAARALQRQKEEAEARAAAQAEEVRRKAEQEAMAKKAAEEAAKAEAAALRQRAEMQAEQERARAIEKARQEQERLRLAAAQMREAEEKRKAMEAERLAEEQRREAEKLAERRKAEALAAAEAQARAEAQAQAQAEAAARAAREAAARYQQEQQSLAAERARAAASSNTNTNANASSAAGKNDAARKGASLATQALNMARRGDDALPGKAPTDKDNAHLAERPARSSFLGRNPNEIQLSFYSDSWEEKIRRIGNINYPRVPRDSAYGSVVVSVRIRSNGSLESVSILKSSGNREIDQATRRIIEMCAPFAAFPPDLRRNFDVIEVRRTLTFPDHPPLFISQ